MLNVQRQLSLFGPIEPYNFQENLIWWDGPFKFPSRTFPSLPKFHNSYSCFPLLFLNIQSLPFSSFPFYSIFYPSFPSITYIFPVFLSFFLLSSSTLDFLCDPYILLASFFSSSSSLYSFFIFPFFLTPLELFRSSFFCFLLPSVPHAVLSVFLCSCKPFYQVYPHSVMIVAPPLPALPALPPLKCPSGCTVAKRKNFPDAADYSLG